MIGRVARLVAGMVLIPVASLGASLATSAPAHAAGCSWSGGVTVVVDPHDLGGRVAVRCAPRDGGKDAEADLVATGFDLTFVQRQPGFVCRVDGAPAADPCVDTPPADAYWSLWWSDGKTGTWSYSSLGVGSLSVPDGGFVALSWQGGGGKAPPRAPAAAPSSTTPPAPTRTATPTPAPTPSATQTAPAPSTNPTGSPAATRTAAGNPTPPRTAHPSALRAPHSHGPRPSSTPDAIPRPTRRTSPATSSGGGLPGWLAPALVVAVFGAAAAVTVVRRRRGGP